jgi:hypothetical protein
MMSDRPKKPKQPSDIARRFRELQQLRKQVHAAELERSRCHPDDIDPKVDDEDRQDH